MSNEDVVPIELSNVAETLAEGGGFWRTCTGCYESEDGYPNGYYPHSTILNCTLGGGCSECGGIGAVWDDTDYDAMADAWHAEEIAREQVERAPTAEQAEGVQTQAARDVLAERQRQVTAEGWTPEHDDEHDEGEMASAAAAYAAHSCGWNDDAVRDLWPPQWHLRWLKTSMPRRDLVKAGALILAEIERLDRATPGTCFFCSEPMNSAHESDCPQAPAASAGDQEVRP